MAISMPFGKYRGQLLSELPLDYLEWVLRIATASWLREAVLAEHRARTQSSSSSSHGGDGHEDGGHHHQHDPRAETSSAPDLHELVARTRRRLATKYHPDAGGGNADLMKGVNLMADALLGRNRHGRR